MPGVAKGRANGWVRGGRDVLTSQAPANTTAPPKPVGRRRPIQAPLTVRSTKEFQFRLQPDIAAAKNEDGLYCKVGQEFTVKGEQDGWCHLDNDFWLPIKIGDELLLDGVNHEWYQVLVDNGVSYRMTRKVESRVDNRFAKKDQIVAVLKVEGGAWCRINNGLFLPLVIKGTFLLKKLEASKIPEPIPEPEKPDNSEATGKAASASPAAPSVRSAEWESSSAPIAPAPVPTSVPVSLLDLPPARTVKASVTPPSPKRIARRIKILRCRRKELNGIYELMPGVEHQGRNVWVKDAGGAMKTKLIRWQDSVTEWVIDDELVDSTKVYACTKVKEDVLDPSEVKNGWTVFRRGAGQGGSDFKVDEAMQVIAAPQSTGKDATPNQRVPSIIPPIIPGPKVTAEPKERPWYMKVAVPKVRDDDDDDANYEHLLESGAQKEAEVTSQMMRPASENPDEPPKDNEIKDRVFHNKMLEYLKIQEIKKDIEPKEQLKPEPKAPRPKPPPQSLLDVKLPPAPYKPPIHHHSTGVPGHSFNPINVPPVVPNPANPRPLMVGSMFPTNAMHSIPHTTVNGYNPSLVAPVIPHLQARMSGRKRGSRGYNGRGRSRGRGYKPRGRGAMRYNTKAMRGGRVGHTLNKFVGTGNGFLQPASTAFKPTQNLLLGANGFSMSASKTTLGSSSKQPATNMSFGGLGRRNRPNEVLIPTSDIGLVHWDNQYVMAKAVLNHPELVCIKVFTSGRLRDKYLQRDQVHLQSKGSSSSTSPASKSDGQKKLDVAAKEFKPKPS